MTKHNAPISIACPEIAAEWHPSLNEGASPNSVTISSTYLAWWRCRSDQAHEWQQRVLNRIKGRCPFCAIAPKSLLALFPEVARQLHPTLNGDLNPQYMAPKSAVRAWWQCDVNSKHVWDALVNSRTVMQSGCPFCGGDKADETNSLASLHPEIAREWHPVKNEGLTPDMVVTRSGRKVWWICQLKHEWQTAISDRTGKGCGCPFCAHRYLLKENSLAVLFPEIAAQWHPTKNRKMLSSIQGTWVPETNHHLAPKDRPKKNRRLTAKDVSSGSHQRIWWQCNNSSEHVWQASVQRRTEGHGCPYCTNQKVSKDNSLAARYPSVANQWHPTRNAPVLPTDVVAGTGKSYWWRCFRSAKHVWQAPVDFICRRWRDGTNGCPFCKGNKVTDESCLKAKNPAVAKLWHPTRNGTLTPKEMPPNSNKVVWWKCPDVSGHEWEAPVTRVVTRNQKWRSGCPFCAGKKVAEGASLASNFPELAKLWHPKLNRPLRPTEVMPASNKVVWWRCLQGRDHIWQRKINYELASWKKGLSGCPKCKEKSG
jgi:hypothetical protein